MNFYISFIFGFLKKILSIYIDSKSIIMPINDFIQKIIKYLVVGLAVAVCAVLIPKKSPSMEEVTMLALVAAATMAVVDTFTNPVIAHSLNQGLGFGLGANLVGFPRFP